MRDIGKNIRDLRIGQNLTQDDLAAKLFVSRQTISNYETGRSRPSIDMLLQIADLLNTDINTVIYGPISLPSRRENSIRSCISTGITLLLGLLSVILAEYGDYLRSTQLDSFIVRIVSFLIKQAFYLFLGWTIMQDLSLFTKLRSFSHPVCRGVCIFLLMLLLFAFIVVLPVLEIPCPKFVNTLTHYILFILPQQPFWGVFDFMDFLIPIGSALWFCDFPFTFRKNMPA